MDIFNISVGTRVKALNCENRWLIGTVMDRKIVLCFEREKPFYKVRFVKGGYEWVPFEMVKA